jgi:hypothetical protein
MEWLEILRIPLSRTPLLIWLIAIGIIGYGIYYVIGLLSYALCTWLLAIKQQLEETNRVLADISKTLKLATHRGDLERIEQEIAAWERRREKTEP